MITPYLRLTTDGKTPNLASFSDAIDKALEDAAGRAYRNIIRHMGEMSLVDAAWTVMQKAYLKASDSNGGPRLPTKVRQIMYAARPLILALTGRTTFTDSDFTQHWLPDYLRAYSEEPADWKVPYDSRGHLREPHTGTQVGLGTLEVDDYIGQRLRRHQRPVLQDGVLFPTTGPENRYRSVLFIEKEGYDELFEAVQLAERYDVALMSTKGMSVVAARKLLDAVAPRVDHIFVLHDFDISGFLIFGTLSSDSRRYTFANDVAGKIVDLGLRLTDAEELGLENEIVKVDFKSRPSRCETLLKHGATFEEIEFLAPLDGECRRVELNAMTSRQLVDRVEEAFAAYSMVKVIPDSDVVEEHARHRLEAKLTERHLATVAELIRQQAEAIALPGDFDAQVQAVLDDDPALSWDQAVDRVVTQLIG